MATINENLQIIKNSTLAMKQAILDKGGTINGDITTWAKSIAKIPSGGYSSLSKGDVTFYDYDGTILYSFSKDTFLALRELPSLPSQRGLICQGWNYDISRAKSYVELYGKLDIGATYITDDSNTRLYIRIDAEGRMTVPLYFSQTVDNGVTIDWGDGETQTVSGIKNVSASHTYASIGDYCITLTPEPKCILGLGHGSSSYCVMGSTGNNGKVYCNMLRKVEIGASVTSIGDYAFHSCYSLSSVVIPSSVTSIGDYVFHGCYSLSSVVMPFSVTSIGSNAFINCTSLSSIIIPSMPSRNTSIGANVFQYCYSLSSIIIPNTITSIGTQAFYYCYGMAYYDFSNHTRIPTLQNTSAFANIPSDCKIIVPDSLYDAWIAASNWSTYASYIIKKSDWDAL